MLHSFVWKPMRLTSCLLKILEQSDQWRWHRFEHRQFVLERCHIGIGNIAGIGILGNEFKRHFLSTTTD
jgi:hypothetical protein